MTETVKPLEMVSNCNRYSHDLMTQLLHYLQLKQHLIHYRNNNNILLPENWLTYCFYSFPQRSASLSIVGFSNDLEMELPSTRLSRSADPQIQDVAAVALGSSPNTRCDCDTPPEPVPSYSLVLGRAPGDLSPGLAPGDTLQSSAKCKVGITQTPLLKRTPFHWCYFITLLLVS